MNMADTKTATKQPEFAMSSVEFALAGVEESFRTKESLAQTSDGYRWAFVCDICAKPGLLFTVDPNSLHVIKPQHWEHYNKTAEEGWNKKFIPCQCCLNLKKPGEKVLLNMTYVEENYDEGIPGGFQITGRARSQAFQQWHITAKKWKYQIDAERRAIAKATEAAQRQAQLSELTKRG